MKVFRLVFLLGLVSLASIAAADCLSCQQRHPGEGPRCYPTDNPGYCSGDCCFAAFLDPCTQPDFLFECFDLAARVNGKEKSYFASPRVRQMQGAAVYARMQNSVKPIQKANCRIANPLIS